MERDLRTDLPTSPRSSLKPDLGPGTGPNKDPDGCHDSTAAGRCFAAGPPPLALYVHLPWCLRKCPYCDFNSHALCGPMPRARYVDALLADLDAQLALSGEDRTLRSLFIGGGTPSLFSGDAIARLLNAVRGRCRLAADAEITLEANPGAVDATHFDGYLRAGVNRLSVGVQSLSAPHLSALGRIHDPRQALSAYGAARRSGFENVNLDLMFGLPGQSLVQARDDLLQLIALQPEHISYYQLTLEPDTPFARAAPPVPDDDLLADMQEQGVALLAAAGYRRYEISAYAQPGRHCRHNLNYWCFGDYIGIGAGAHGKITDAAVASVERRTRQHPPEAYLGNSCRFESRRRLADDDLVLEFALNALRLVDGVDEKLFELRTGLAPGRITSVLKRARNDGLLTTKPERIGPSSLGLRFLDELLLRFAHA